MNIVSLSTIQAHAVPGEVPTNLSIVGLHVMFGKGTLKHVKGSGFVTEITFVWLF